LFPFPPVHADDGDQEENFFVLLRALDNGAPVKDDCRAL